MAFTLLVFNLWFSFYLYFLSLDLDLLFGRKKFISLIWKKTRFFIWHVSVSRPFLVLVQMSATLSLKGAPLLWSKICRVWQRWGTTPSDAALRIFRIKPSEPATFPSFISFSFASNSGSLKLMSFKGVSTGVDDDRIAYVIYIIDSRSIT